MRNRPSLIKYANNAQAIQSGVLLEASILQHGYGHDASIVQAGYGKEATINQHGFYGSAEIHQLSQQRTSPVTITQFSRGQASVQVYQYWDLCSRLMEKAASKKQKKQQ